MPNDYLACMILLTEKSGERYNEIVVKENDFRDKVVFRECLVNEIMPVMIEDKN